MGPPAGSAAPPPPPPPNPNPGYTNPPYGNPPVNNPPVNNPQYGNPQYGNPQSGNPQYGNPQAGNPQYGNPQYGNPPGNPPPGNNPYYQGGAPGAVAQSGLEENVACALCYALTVITGILFLVLAPYNQNRLIRFHAFQSILFWAAAVVIWIVKFFLFSILISLPFVGAMLSIMLSAVLSLGLFIVWAMLIYKAYNRERWVLPIIGPLAEKQA